MSNEDNSKAPLISQSNKQAFRNPWVLGWLGLLIFVLLVNAGMITTAYMTSPGLVDKDYYEKGRDQEENMLKKRAARNALGWSFKLDLPEQIVVGKDATIRFNVVDKFGVALKDIKVELTAYRPSDINADFSINMQAFAAGQYQADAVFHLKGVWELQIKAMQTDENQVEKTYELIQQRISVQAL